jgi:peptidoglycan pentaglycine glycine transferase (the first glycine)
MFYSGTAFYHHAISVPQFSKMSVPYAVMWEAIVEAKRRGCSMFDFWGYIDPEKQPKHPWAGPTLFKMGFGGKSYEYVKTQDYPLSWRYWPIAIFETIRRIRRGL